MLYGKFRPPAPTQSTTQPIAKNLLQVIKVATHISLPNLVQIPGGLLCKWVKYKWNLYFFFRNSQSRRPVDRDAPNNTDSRKGVHLGSHWHCSPFRGSNQPKLRHTAQCILPVKSLSCRWSASIYDSPAAKDHRATKRGLTSFLNPDFNRPLVSIQVCNSGWLGTIYPSYIS